MYLIELNVYAHYGLHRSGSCYTLQCMATAPMRYLEYAHRAVYTARLLRTDYSQTAPL